MNLMFISFSSYLRLFTNLSIALSPIKQAFPILLDLLSQDILSFILTPSSSSSSYTAMMSMTTNDPVILSPTPIPTMSSAIPLLILLLQEDKTGHLQQSVIRQGDLPLALLNYLQQTLSPALIDPFSSSSSSSPSPSPSQQQRQQQQQQQQRNQVHQIMLLLTTIASTQVGAVALLTLSIFSVLVHCPLLQAIRDTQYGMLPHYLPTDQQKYLRELLADLIVLALQLHAAVVPIRSIDAELTSLVQAFMPLTTMLFKYEEEEKVAAIQLIGLYLGLLTILAKQPERFRATLQGYDTVMETKVIELLHGISREEKAQKHIAKWMSARAGLFAKEHMQLDLTKLYRMAVENGMMFLSEMGIRIGDEYINGFGLKNLSA